MLFLFACVFCSCSELSSLAHRKKAISRFAFGVKAPFVGDQSETRSVWNGLYIKKKRPGSSKPYNGSEWLLIFNSGLRRMYRHSVSSVENMLDSWEPRFIYSKGKSVSSWLKQKSSNICLYKTVFRTSNLWPVFCFAFSSTLLRSAILTSLRAYVLRQLEIMVYKVLNMSYTMHWFTSEGTFYDGWMHFIGLLVDYLISTDIHCYYKAWKSQGIVLI